MTAAAYDQPLRLESNQTISHSMCLEEGRFQFTIFDSGGDGICCDYGQGEYSISSGGQIIFQGGTFGGSEATTFSLPYKGAGKDDAL